MPKEASDGLGSLLDELSAPQVSGLLLVPGALLSAWSVSRCVGVVGIGNHAGQGVPCGLTPVGTGHGSR